MTPYNATILIFFSPQSSVVNTTLRHVKMAELKVF
jgi:hypothetical protein